MYSYGSPHMAAQKQDDQLERTFSSYVRIQDVVLKTYLGRWTIGRSGERGSGISVLPARYDDDDIVNQFYCRSALQIIAAIEMHWPNKSVYIINIVLLQGQLWHLLSNTGWWAENLGWEFGDFEKDVSWDSTLGRASPAGGWLWTM